MTRKMTRKTSVLLVLALLSAFSLGCGLLDSLTKSATEKGAEIVEQGKATLEAVVTEAAPTQPPSDGAKQATQAPTAAPAQGDTIDLTALTSVEELDSFRMTSVITWTKVMTDNTSESGIMEMLTETDRASQSSRFRLSGELPDTTGGVTPDGDVMEMIQIGNNMYMSTAAGEWIAMQAGAEGSGEPFGWISDPRDFFAHGSGTYVKTEREPVNGYRDTKLYRHSESGVGGLGFGAADKVESDVWVAEVGQGADKVAVIVRVVSTWSGTDADKTEWLGGIQIDVTDINEPIAIEPPEGVEAPGMPADVPIMDGATNVQSMMGINTYSIAATADEVIGFYDEEMRVNGWEADEGGIPGMRTYTKENRQATLIVEETDDGSEVTIMIVEQ